MSLKENIEKFRKELEEFRCKKLIAVSKTYPPEVLLEAYNQGIRIFGENKVQELLPKYEALPKDIEWHLIGHLQTNKVKYIAPFISLIHSVDSLKLLQEINKQALKNNRVIPCLLQIYIASEESKFGLSFEEAEELLQSDEMKKLDNILISGFMGMTTNTEDTSLIRNEFKSLRSFYERWKGKEKINIKITELSMGMSNDYHIALEEGSTMVRIGSAIFGRRK
jgi:pyridoxal phosphate enzyme (YggS family)